ncbi:class I SAM-dependent methyltransferase [Sphingomonas psychrotolerans]|uniref:class I SAM-dependent methyltransferase n=1 Tax=Sphingomonas psychrotolerans TaxID=1327635 RepID=UPI0013052E96|nr:class I SAM-dependent methyltransferase [Sphingomonas psychrotolerans]
MKTWPGMKVVDIGCGVDGRSFRAHADPSWRVTGIDRTGEEVRPDHPNFTFARGSACDLSIFADKSFDLAVSVGMLEHITEPDAFAAACSEIRRVATQWLVIVPWRYAPVEPHYPLPFFGAWPERAQIAGARLFNIGGQRRHLAHDPGFLRRQTVWRTTAEYAAAFPGCRVRLSGMAETLSIAPAFPRPAPIGMSAMPR